MSLISYVRLMKIYKNPAYVIFHPTSRCNCKCGFCLNVNNSEKELLIPQIEKISKNLNSFPILTLSGGEPFLRDDISKIVKIFYQNNKPAIVSIVTNGSFPEKASKEVTQILRDCPHLILKVTVSVDDIKEKHNKIRKHNGLFKKAIKTYKNIEKLTKTYRNLRLDASLTLSSLNQQRIQEILNQLKTKYRLNIPGIAFPYGKESDKISLDKYSNTLMKSNKLSNRIFFKVNEEVIKRKKTKKRSRCFSGRKIIFINSKGNVYPCELLKKRIGNLLDNNIKDIQRSEKSKEVFDGIDKRKCFCLWCNPIVLTYLINPLKIIFK